MFRKMQAGEVGASNSDILTDKADDDALHVRYVGQKSAGVLYF